MPLSFRSNGTLYVGFKHLTCRADLANGCKLAIVWFDGEPDLWVVEDEAGLANLKKFYTGEWDVERIMPITVLTPERS